MLHLIYGTEIEIQVKVFAENNQYLTKSDNNRVQGWLAVHEWLKLYTDEQGQLNSKLKIFSNCTNLIRTLPAVIHDEKNPNDVATEPHELTHMPDALRGFCVMYQTPATKKITLPKEGYYSKTELEDLGYTDIETPTKGVISLSKRRR